MDNKMESRKIQVLWEATKPMYVGVGDTLKDVGFGGVEEFESFKEVHTWLENQTVSFGEESGSFHVIGFWVGSFESLKNGAKFYSKYPFGFSDIKSTGDAI